jgi:23S rRNA (uracil1939-C5)-methyltransferase
MASKSRLGVVPMIEEATVEATVQRLAYGGEGVARVDGLVVFVPWTVPGERVRATVVERHSRYARARLEAVLEPAATRIEPRCPVFGSCGGCQLQHLTVAAQREAKAQAVVDAMERIGGHRELGGLVCEPAASGWGYRKRAVVSWRWTGDELDFGYHHVNEPGRIISIGGCPIVNDRIDAHITKLRGALELALRDHTVAFDSGILEGRLALRCLPSGPVQAGLFVDQTDLARHLARALSDNTDIETTWGSWRTESSLKLATDAPRLISSLQYRGLDLRIGFDSFIQADLSGAEKLYDAVIEAVGPASGKRVIDAYAGIGVVACQLATAGAGVTAIEAHSGTASDLRANAHSNVATGSVHVLELPADRVQWARPRPEIVILNPPRGGCPRRVLSGISDSPARRLVYVACDPATLARDVRRLGMGWRLESLRAFDLFPQTAHVETVAVLLRPNR